MFLTDDLRQNLAQVTKKAAMDFDEAQVERNHQHDPING